MSTTKVSSFVKLVLAMIQGDDAQIKAIKIQKKASAALTAQIAVKKAVTLNLEECVEAAQENIAISRVNSGKIIENTDDYLQALISRKKYLDLAEEALQDHLDTIAFLEEELETINS